MRIVVIGAVAAGTSAAAKARRTSEDAEIIVYEKETFISYSGCGMPYHIGGEVERSEELTPRDPAFFKKKYNVDIFTAHEVLSFHAQDKTLTIKNRNTGVTFEDHYDKLILAMGANVVIPPIKGADSEHVFTLRNIGQMHQISQFIHQNTPKRAVIIGSGFIGLELCEGLRKLNMHVTLLEKLNQVTPGLDPDMATYVEKHLQENGVEVIKGAAIEEINNKAVLLSDGEELTADIVIIAAGVRPNTEVAKRAGIELGESGAIKVNHKLETNLDDIYACGDCMEQFNLLTGKPVYRPLGSTANKTGRIAGYNALGGDLAFRGILGTGIFRIFNLTVAQTGLSEKEAKNDGFDIVVSHNIKPNKAEYMGGRELVIKSIANRSNGKILGVQIIGEEGVDKRIDVFVSAISFGAKAEDLFHLDLAYAPPFSTTKDPVMYTGMILDNAINQGRPIITSEQVISLMESGEKVNLIDARLTTQYNEGHIEGAMSMPHERLRAESEHLDKDLLTITYCNKGTTGNAAQNILLNKGFKKVYNLSGGHQHYKKQTN